MDKAVWAKAMEIWRNDWVAFAEDVMGVYLDTEQADILRAVQHYGRVSVASGTARGKDFIAGVAAMCFFILTPKVQRTSNGVEMVENTKIALTAPTDRQVKNIMIPEISRLFNAVQRRLPDRPFPARLLTDGIRTDYAEWFLTGFKADEHNHEAWSGFHAVHTMFVVTEATGISDDTFAAIEGNLQGDSRILLVFNPNTAVGYAARSQKDERWRRFRLNSLTAPNVRERRIVIPGQVDYEWVADKVESWCTPIQESEVQSELDDFEFEGQWYRPEDLFRKKVLGQFPRVPEDTLIPPQWLEIAHERWRSVAGKEQPSTEPRVIGVDVAGMGRDSTCFCERKGAWVAQFEVRNSGGQADHMKVAGLIEHRRKLDPRAYVSIDTIGEGAGVYSRCVELDDRRYILSCKYSEGARDAGGREFTDITGQYNFANMRAYLFWCVRDWLNPRNGAGAMLPPDARLDEETSEIRWSFRSDGRILIEPKEDIRKRLGRSTDLFDSLANTFYPVARRGGVDTDRLARLIGR